MPVGGQWTSAIMRVMLLPLTAWDLGRDCTVECLQIRDEYSSGDKCNMNQRLKCSTESASSVCDDVVPAGTNVWMDERTRDCLYYQAPQLTPF